MPSPSLPPRPSLEQLRKRAKDLLKAFRDRQPAALSRLKAALPRYSDLSDDDLTELALSLRDAQRVIAIEYRFTDWPSMRAYIEQKERAAMIEMTVDHVRVNIPGNQRVVVLKAKEINRYLPIWIGQSEGDAIALSLQGQQPTRPMTHDLTDAIIRGLDATVDRVVVNEMRDDTFISHVRVKSNGTTFETDSRPSDAIALAVRSGAQVLVAPEVLEEAGIDFDPETGKPTSPNRVWPEFSVLAPEVSGPRHHHPSNC